MGLIGGAASYPGSGACQCSKAGAGRGTPAPACRALLAPRTRIAEYKIAETLDAVFVARDGPLCAVPARSDLRGALGRLRAVSARSTATPRRSRLPLPDLGQSCFFNPVSYLHHDERKYSVLPVERGWALDTKNQLVLSKVACIRRRELMRCRRRRRGSAVRRSKAPHTRPRPDLYIHLS